MEQASPTSKRQSKQPNRAIKRTPKSGYVQGEQRVSKEHTQEKFSRHGGDFFDTGLANPASPVGTAWKPATRLLERFQLIRQLGRGGQAEVWQAYDLISQRLVALKKFFPALKDQNEIARFFREIGVLSSLHHPNIVKLHDVYPEHFFYSMEYLEGQTLREVLDDAKQPLPLQQVLAWTRTLADALLLVHQKTLIHRDIKPENIMIVKGQEAKLIDFGVALMENNSRLTTHGQVGTPYYMAPEQIERKGEMTASVDIFALGVVFFEMLTLSLPHAYSSLQEIRSDLPKATVERLEILLQGMLHRQANKRSSLASLHEQLRAFQKETDGITDTSQQHSNDFLQHTDEQEDPHAQDNPIFSSIPKGLIPHTSFLSSNGDKQVLFFSRESLLWKVLYFFSCLLFLFFAILCFIDVPNNEQKSYVIGGGIFFLMISFYFGMIALTKRFWILTDLHFYARFVEHVDIVLSTIETVRLKDKKLIFIQKEKSFLGFAKKIEVDGVVDADIFHQKIIRQLEEIET
jgi:serine/threonine protein kinase